MSWLLLSSSHSDAFTIAPGFTYGAEIPRVPIYPSSVGTKHRVFCDCTVGKMHNYTLVIKSCVMVTFDVLSNNIQDTVLLSSHANRINRNFPNHSTVFPCWGLESTHRFSYLELPQHPIYSLVQETHQCSWLSLPELHHRCYWFQSCHLLIPNFCLAFLN